MIRYRYAAEVQPPAPFVNVSVRCPSTNRQIERLPALLDSGSDCTVLPSSVVAALDLVQVGLQECQDFHADRVMRSVFLVAVSIHEFPAVEVRAILEERQTHILLGRDVLNSRRIVVDGPRLTLEIE